LAFYLASPSSQDKGIILKNAYILFKIVTTRSDPPWPLSSWRVKGKMAEVRMTDLKFTEEETASFFVVKTAK